jgi:putative FmdB family regulatory protein
MGTVPQTAETTDAPDGQARAGASEGEGASMPIYEYEAADERRACDRCRAGFEVLQSLRDPALKVCPTCGAEVRKRISASAVGGSKSNFDSRAKAAGFHKLQRLGKGEYEKKY